MNHLWKLNSPVFSITTSTVLKYVTRIFCRFKFIYTLKYVKINEYLQKIGQIKLFIWGQRKYFLFVFYIILYLLEYEILVHIPMFISFEDTPPIFLIFQFSYVYNWKLKIGLIHVQVFMHPIEHPRRADRATDVNSTLRDLETVSNSSAESNHKYLERAEDCCTHIRREYARTVPIQ
jgi:hypothetical protein